MPIYSYRCDECGIQFDRRQHFEDKPLKRCPECNKLSLRKLYQPVGIVFKGSGFYSTDNRSASNSTVSSFGESTSSDAKEEKDKASGSSKSDEKPKPNKRED